MIEWGIAVGWTTIADLDRWFVLRRPGPDDAADLDAIRSAGKAFARLILERTPGCADQSAAVRHVRQATQWAESAVVCHTSRDSAQGPTPPRVHVACSETGGYEWVCPACDRVNHGRSIGGEVACVCCTGRFEVF